MTRLNWSRDGRSWPNGQASRFVVAGGLRWHVQQAGQGPVVLLLHGTGASTHSWRTLFPMLAERHTVIAIDLPGHAFTDALPARKLSLPGMADAVSALMETLGAQPEIIVGHSAGAAVAIRMTLDGHASPRVIVSLNGALTPVWSSTLAPLFVAAAKLLAMNPLTPWLFARRARDPAVVDRLLAGTGSRLTAEDVRLYRRLASQPSHVAGALGMMAGWDLRAFERDLPRLKTPLILVAGAEDGMIPASAAHAVRVKVPNARVVTLAGLGHLAHEEAPELVRDIIDTALEEAACA